MPISAPTSELGRNAAFGGVITSSVAVMLYPALPATVRAAFAPEAFTAVVGSLGVVGHRAIMWVFTHLIGPFATDATKHLRLVAFFRRLAYYQRLGAISAAESRRLAREAVIAAELGFSAPMPRLPGSPQDPQLPP